MSQRRSIDTESTGWPAALLACAVVAAAVVAFYVSIYPIRGFQVALGSDTPVYVWWLRSAGWLGLGTFDPGTRSATVGALATLSTVTGIPPAGLLTAAGAALCTTAALAAAAWLRSSLGARQSSFVLAALLSGTFLSLMAPGYFSTLAFFTLFLAGMACLAESANTERWAPVAAAAILLATAGLSHLLFMALGGALLLGAVAGVVGPSLLRRTAVDAPSRSAVVRLVTAVAGAAGLALGGVALVGPGSTLPIDTSRDALLRRTGLISLLRDSYRRKLVHDFPLYRAVTYVGLALSPLLANRLAAKEPPDENGDPPARRMFWGAVAVWVAVTAVGLILLAVGTLSPGQRLAAVFMPAPLLAALGLSHLSQLSRLWRPNGEAGAGYARRAALAAGAALFVAVSFMPWWQGRPVMEPEILTQAAIAGTKLAREVPGKPFVLVTDSDADKPGLFVVRHANYLLGAVPPPRLDDVRVFVGRPEDFVDRRVDLSGNPEHDAIARAYWADVRPVLERRPLVLMVEAFDHKGWELAVEVPGAVRLTGLGVALLPSRPGEEVPAFPSSQVVTEALRYRYPVPVSPWLAVWLAPVLVALLTLVGMGWSHAFLGRGSEPLVRLALAPTFGLAAVAATSIVVDAFGLRLAESGGYVAGALSLAGGLVAAAVRIYTEVWGSGSQAAQ